MACGVRPVAASARVTTVALPTVTVTSPGMKRSSPWRRSSVAPRTVSVLPLRAVTLPTRPSRLALSRLVPANTRVAVKVWSLVCRLPNAAESVPTGSAASAVRPAVPVELTPLISNTVWAVVCTVTWPNVVVGSRNGFTSTT